MILFFIGFISGGTVGVVVMCLFQVSRRVNSKEEGNSNPHRGFHI